MQSLDPKQTAHLKEPEPISQERFNARVLHFLTGSEDAYERINGLRNWFNGNYFPEFEFYLEDVWNEHVDGETHFEYILRHTQSADETAPFAYDIYSNHQDNKGVWHLGDYSETVIHVSDAQPFVDFMNRWGVSWAQ